MRAIIRNIGLVILFVISFAPALTQAQVGSRTQVQTQVSDSRTVMTQLESSIANLEALVASLEQQLETHRTLVDELRAMGARPAEPPEAVESYDEKFNALSAQISRVSNQIEQTQARIENAQTEITRLQSSDLPVAQARDQQRMQRQLEEERKALEQKAQALSRLANEQEQDAADALSRTETRPTLRQQPNRATGGRVPAPAGSGLPIE